MPEKIRNGKFRQLTNKDRIQIEALVKAKSSVPEIAKIIGCHRSTIYRELKRGEYMRKDSTTWLDVKSYSYTISIERHEHNKMAHSKGLKVGNDYEFVKYIEHMICDMKYSPTAALAEIQRKGMVFDTCICPRTLYNYIYDGLFLNIEASDLPYEHEKKKKKRVRPVQVRGIKGESIEDRPEDIEKREEFGHWEMDTLIGKNRKGQVSCFVMTERKTRLPVIIPLKTHTSAAVVESLDALESRFGSENFKKIFKSITTDNGSEFMNYNGMITSIDGKNIRTRVFYCHAYSSYEKGSVENQNRLIRRWIPKGKSMNDLELNDFKSIENWISNYPRLMFGWKTPKEMFEAELKALKISA